MACLPSHRRLRCVAPQEAVLPGSVPRLPADIPAAVELHHVLLPRPVPLTVIERELIAAYASGLNTWLC